MVGPGEKLAAFHEIVNEVACALAVATHETEGSYVRTPVLYPGGSMVVVRISEQSQGRFLVSDMGLGQMEADMMGAAATFVRVAPQIAEHAGIAFDHRAFSVLGVERDQLVGAVATIASCSQEAVQLTAFKLAEKRTVDAAERLYGRLVKVFATARVARDAEIMGASQTPWHVAILVTADGRRAAYEPVSNHPNSVAAAVTKFFDIAQLEHPPGRIAVVQSKQALGTRLNVIAGAAKVIEESASDETLEKLALAA